MAVQNFVFWENWVRSKVDAGMKTTFFAIFDPTWTNILAPKGPDKEFVNKYFCFQSIRKTEIKLSIL